MISTQIGLNRMAWVILVMTLSQSAFSQPVDFRLKLTGTDFLRSDTVEFGYHPSASRCIDTALGEYEWPPNQFPWCNQGIFHLRFVDPNYYQDSCLGAGLRLDLRPPSTVDQADTFTVLVCQGSFPVVLRWPATIGSYFDSSRIIYGREFVWHSLNMATQDSVSSDWDVFTILTWGARTPTDVAPEEARLRGFALDQNYPNPFNPRTTISINLDVTTDLTLKIFDLLGEEVETITSGVLEPGVHHFTWTPIDKPSGVYYYRLQTDDYTVVKKLIFMR